MIIDFHTHILPKIDDGSQSVNESVYMLRQEYLQKVDLLVATPHFYASRDSVEHFLKRRQRSIIQMQDAVKDESNIPQWCAGAEVYYFPGMGKADMLSKLCIGDTDVLLLELPFCQWTKEIYQDVKQIVEKQNIQIILAHVERYYEFQKNQDVWNAIFELPVYAQINAESLLKWKRRKFVLKFLKKENPVVLGSDCHNMERRPPNLQEGRNVIEKKLGMVALNQIDELGKRILQ